MGILGTYLPQKFLKSPIHHLKVQVFAKNDMKIEFPACKVSFTSCIIHTELQLSDDNAVDMPNLGIVRKEIDCVFR